MLRAGIAGLANVGKSTLFNALTAQATALAANYPFASNKSNVGIVPVPDERLEPLAKIVKTSVIIPATVEFVDIPGLVRGSSRGEGLGNQFLANIRESDTVVQVVRCFEDDEIVHVEGSVNPRRDIETVQIELALADLATVERRRERSRKNVKGGRQASARRVGGFGQAATGARRVQARRQRRAHGRRAENRARPLPAHGEADHLRRER